MIDVNSVYSGEKTMYNTPKEFILDNWDKVIRENKEDNDTLIGLPYPYTVPCIGGMFQEMYYWDTYFTNVGLILSGRINQAKNNVDNMCYLISRYGFMPNGNRTGYLSRSQPPFLSIMVMEIYDETKDKEWLAEKYETLKTEYAFWQNNRKTENGLARYFGKTDDHEYRLKFGRYLYSRFGMDAPTDEATLCEASGCMYSFAESGWDCTTRFGLRGQYFNAIDLNCLLYSLESNLSKISEILGGDSTEYKAAAENRKALIDKYLWSDEKGTYFDYDFQRKEQNNIHSTAAFYALLCELTTQEKAEKIKATLPKLEQLYGLTCTEKLRDSYELQWDYPNGWACQQFVAIKGLLNYGFTDDAKRIAEKYVAVVDKNFATTENLWEKYNVVTGEISTAKEYKSPEMMGWSAGVYLYCLKLLEK